jgi:surface antigen
MKTTITGVFKPFKALFRGLKRARHIFKTIKQKVKLNIVRFLSPEKARKLKSLYQNLLSKQNKNFIHVGIIIVAISIGVFNVWSSNEVTVSAKDSSILVDLLFPEDEQYEVVKSDFSSSESKEKNYLPMVSIASAAFVSGSINNQEVMAADAKGAEEEEELNVIGEDTLVKSNPIETTTGVKTRTKAIKHKVLGGETISTIAQRYGIDAATILQENELYADDVIKPGMDLTILPVSGTTERVDSGETLSGIASKHDADLDSIKDFNGLMLASDIEEGQILIIPDGKREVKERPRPETQANTTLARGSEETRAVAAAPRTTTTTSSTPTVNRGPSVGNRFPWGYCTWYVASVRGDVTWRGNAGQWLGNAAAQGRATGRVPAVGSIMVTNESWWGHVAYVEAVHGDRVTVSEMNYAGYGVKSTRTVSNSSGVIKGYIY